MSESAKHNWKDKLNQCPVPEGVSWTNMEQLLDVYLPTNINKRNRSRYILLLLLLLFIGIGTCLWTGDEKMSSNGPNKGSQNDSSLTVNAKVNEQEKKQQKSTPGSNEYSFNKTTPNGKSVEGDFYSYTHNETIATRKALKIKPKIKTSLKSSKYGKDTVNLYKEAKLKTIDLTENKVGFIPNVVLTDTVLSTSLPSNVIDSGERNKTDLILPQTIVSNAKEKEQLDSTATQVPKQNKGNRINISLGFDYIIQSRKNTFSELTRQGDFTFSSNVIPVLGVSFQLSSNAYLQAELQPIAPQFIQKDLLQERVARVSPSPGAPGYVIISRVYLKKLFYFNVPVTFHYRLANGIYGGIGIQYSKLKTGAGVYEEQKRSPGQPDSILSIDYREIESGLLNAAVKPNEFRYGLSLAAKIKRFDFGLRYTRAFDTYQNRSVSSQSGIHNQSLLFFARYNILNIK